MAEYIIRSMTGKGKASKLDLDRLVLEVRGMQYWHPLFNVTIPSQHVQAQTILFLGGV